MGIVLGTIQLIMTIVICIAEFKRKSSSVFLWATLLIMFSVMHFITCIISSVEYSSTVLNTASVYVILFEIVYLLMRKILSNKKKTQNMYQNRNKEECSTRDKKFYDILSILMVVIIVLQLFILITNAGGIFNTSWESMRASSSGNAYFSFSQVFTTLFLALSSSILISFSFKDKKRNRILIALLLLEVLISRNRVEILPLICAFIIIIISKIRYVKLNYIIYLIIVTIAIIYVIYGLRIFRRYGTLNDFLNEFSFSDFNTKISQNIKTDDGELGLRKYFYYFINNNEFEDFGEGNTYKRMFLIWLPTNWSMGLKPNDFAISMGHAVNSKIKGYSIHPTLFGDCYANFGFLGFALMGMFWAIYVSIIDNIIKKNKSNVLGDSLVLMSAVSYIFIRKRFSV